MAAYILSFEIHSNSTYASRYQSLMKRVEEIAPNRTWDETTSFVAFSSSMTLENIHHTLFFDTELTMQDKYLVINLTTHKYLARHIDYPNTLADALRG